MTAEPSPFDDVELAHNSVYAVYSDEIIELLIHDQIARFGGVLRPYPVVYSIAGEGEDLLPIGRCLANAILYASMNEECEVYSEDYALDSWQVVVGYATLPTGEHAGIPLAHAWVVQPFDGLAFDVTWRDVADVTYVGLPLRRR